MHFAQLLEAVDEHPELYDYLPYGPFHKADPQAVAYWHEHRIRSDPETLLFAVIDKTQPAPESHPDQGGPLAGVMAYLFTWPNQLSTEIGHVLTFPKWHKTFLTTNAVALLLIHALETPKNGGWGLRRVQWQANDLNKPSIRTAQRMGLAHEGVIRWQRLMHVGPTKFAASVEGREGDPRPDVRGRHSAMLAMCWDTYDRAALEKLIARTQ